MNLLNYKVANTNSEQDNIFVGEQFSESFGYVLKNLPVLTKTVLDK